MKEIVTVNFYVVFMKSFVARQPYKMPVKFVPTGVAWDHPEACENWYQTRMVFLKTKAQKLILLWS